MFYWNILKIIDLCWIQLNQSIVDLFFEYVANPVKMSLIQSCKNVAGKNVANPVKL